MTPIGTKALTAQTENDFMLIIQRQFEETACGSICMHNQNVTSMLDIDEKSATEFLINSCNNLTCNTSKEIPPQKYIIQNMGIPFVGVLIFEGFTFDQLETPLIF